MARELEWDAYLLRSATVYEEACGDHTITQGGDYQYGLGLEPGFRSWLHYLLPITYSDPGLARQILSYAVKLQPPGHAGQLPYGTGAFCTPVQLEHSNDLDFWLMLAAVEYGLGSRDTAFFHERLRVLRTRLRARRSGSTSRSRSRTRNRWSVPHGGVPAPGPRATGPT